MFASEKSPHHQLVSRAGAALPRPAQPAGLLWLNGKLERILIQSFSEFLIRNSEFLHTSAVWKYVGGGGRGLGAGGVAGGRPEHGRHRRLQVHQPRRWHFALRSTDQNRVTTPGLFSARNP